MRTHTLSVQVLFAAFKGPVRDALDSGGFYKHVPKSRLFPTVHDAVTFAHSQLNMPPIDVIDSALRNRHNLITGSAFQVQSVHI